MGERFPVAKAGFVATGNARDKSRTYSETMANAETTATAIGYAEAGAVIGWRIWSGGPLGDRMLTAGDDGRREPVSLCAWAGESVPQRLKPDLGRGGKCPG